MKNSFIVVLLGMLSLVLMACGQGCVQDKKNASSEEDSAAFNLKPKSEFKEVQWTDLMPLSDLEALMIPPAYVTAVPEGSLEDIVGNNFPDMANIPYDHPYQQALVSTRIIPEMDGQAIKLPGFIVPLEFNDKKLVTQFFLVPYFGACIHVPPPPPNQIIFVNYPAGLPQEALEDPFWLYGVLRTTFTENEVGNSAYSMDLHLFEVYSE